MSPEQFDAEQMSGSFRDSELPFDTEPGSQQPRNQAELSAMLAAGGRTRSKGGALERPPKSLPVLAAFQDYLEAERKRARNRMLIVSGFFAIILIAVIACGAMAFVMVQSQMKNDMAILQDKLNTVATTTDSEQDKFAQAVARLEGRTEEWFEQMREKQEEERRKPAPVAAVTPTPPAKDPELDAKLERLLAENEKLNKQLSVVRADLPSLKRQVKEALDERRGVRSTRPAPVAVTPAEPTATTPSVAAAEPVEPQLHRVAAPAVIDVTIQPTGKRRPIKLQLPTPE